ncbi:TetR/AcrR family transcriptional regulator [Ensifer sp. 1H6]|uniref:TetR/AcrR family transcriptional regulator n=1 Tax=Ensifer sp. 1H6 TaxID=1911585 RepID=UPI0009CEC798|nr:TetR/AcrR family transcriptional regulator [Ensifer sp. 1H6]OMQ31298.1 TetR family transcriptional regulator [Ensifer sp. 1H6]
MARSKEFDKEQALDAAIDVFREHGFEGTSTDMLIKSMKIGRQSLYDTFGDKWDLYRSSVERYAMAETSAHIETLRSEVRAVEGIRAMVGRVVAEANKACLGVGSICEFGQTRPDLIVVNQVADRRLKEVMRQRIAEAQAAGDLSLESSPAETAEFLIASFAGIRIAARGGADFAQLESLGRLALRAVR